MNEPTRVSIRLSLLFLAQLQILTVIAVALGTLLGLYLARMLGLMPGA